MFIVHKKFGWRGGVKILWYNIFVTLVPGVQMFRMLRPSVLMWLEGHTFVGSLGAGRKLYQGNENTINNSFNVS